MDFGGPDDVNYDDVTNRALLRKCFGVLTPRGRVMVIDFLAEPGKPASTFAWLLSTMMDATQGTRSLSSAEIRELLRDCGASRSEVGGTCRRAL